jgi:hypothetical protein
MPPEKPRGRPSSEGAASQNVVELAKDHQRHLDNPNTHSPQEPRDDKDVLIARGRLADARKWFEHRGWDVLPQNERGQRILQWGADHAWLAAPSNPQRSVRRWCKKYAPRLTAAELDRIVAETRTSNKRWSHDHSAMVLEITVRDLVALGLRFLGASDDLNHEIRLGIARAKAAARGRRFRADHSTGRKPGRPSLGLSAEDMQARRRVQAKERKRRSRMSRKNPSRDISNICGVTQFSVTQTAPRPIEAPSATIRVDAIDYLTGIDFTAFGITAVVVMRGPDVVSHWRRGT